MSAIYKQGSFYGGSANLPNGGTIGQALVKKTNANQDVEWGNVQSLPAGGTQGQALIKQSSAAGDAAWDDIDTLPSGGTAGQALIKQSSVDGDASWNDIDALPSGGTTGQFLKKRSSTDGDAEWDDVQALPSGGTTGQALLKHSNTDGDVEWGTVQALPSGGTTGQVLRKHSNTDGDVEWATVESIQVDSMPSANVSLLGKVVQFIGTSTSTYTHGFFYECVADGANYAWENVEVQPVVGQQFETMPTASADYEGEIHQYTGANVLSSGKKLGAGSATYRKGYFYECVNNSGTYSWELARVQETDVVRISQADFDQLSQAEKDCGKAYFIYDMNYLSGQTPVYNPVGTIISFFGLTAPEGYLVCDGSTYNRSTYPVLAQHLVSQFPDLVGDGSTTFKVPDLRGEFLRGTGTNSHTGQGSGANVGVHQDGTEIPDLIVHTNGTLYTARLNSTTNTVSKNADSKVMGVAGTNYVENHVPSGDTVNSYAQTLRITSRPTNISVLYCIKF